MRVVKNQFLYQITFMPRMFPVNCYFVEEEDGLTLIDAALPYSAKGILGVSRSIGKPITKILLTHAHGDHVGALDAIKYNLPDVPVYVSSRDHRLMGGDRSLDKHEEQTPIKGGVPKNLRTRGDILLKEGDVVGSLTAIETPGHTPGSMSFFDKRTGAVVAGDAYQTRSGIAVSGDMRPLFPFPAMATWSKRAALVSARKLVDLEPELLAVGHGDLVAEPRGVMRKAIASLERKIGG